MGKRWAFMEVFRIPNFDTDEDYLTRLRIVSTPLFAIFLHRINTPDSRPTLHDHPWNFTAIMLRGGYEERRLDPITRDVHTRTVKRVNRMRTHDAHSIMRLLRKPTWTLMFVGRRARTWGYWERDVIGVRGEWIWTEFDKHEHSDEFLEALERRKAEG